MKFGFEPKTGLETLQRYVRTIRYAAPLALGIFLLVIVVLLLALGKQTPRDQLLLLLSILFGAGLFTTLLLRFVFSKLLVGVKKAIRLIETVEPRRMFVRFTGVMTMSGSVVKLWDADADEQSPGLVLASVRTVSKKQGSRKEAVPVNVYFSSTSDQALVFEVPQEYAPQQKRSLSGLSAGNVFWGRLCDRRQLETSWKQIRLLLLGITLFSVCFVGMLAWISQRTLESAKEELALARESLSWPEAPGVILSSKLAEVTIKSGKSRVPGYEARIRYEYTLDKGTFTNTRIFFGYDAGRRRAPAEQLVARYPRGASVTIHYQPQDPSLAVLEPGHENWNQREVAAAEQAMWIALAMSSLIFFVPLVLYILMRRRRDKLLEELRQAMGLGGMGASPR